MATLQTIRSKGPLLVIVIGLALFAFIAGDAWKILQPHQGAQNVGKVNGESLSAQDYQKMVDELSEVFKLTSGMNSLSDDQLTNVKDQVWNTYVTNQLIANEAEKLGFKTCLIPESNKKDLKDNYKLDIIGIKNVNEAMKKIGLK